MRRIVAANGAAVARGKIWILQSRDGVPMETRRVLSDV